MALVQFGAIVTDISGSIGGWTFQRNRGGNIVRLRGNKTKFPTNKQSVQQNQLNTFISLFQQLTQVQKDLWNAFAVANTKENQFGQVKTLSGFNWFFSINANRVLFSLSILNSPPTHITPVGVQDYDINLTDTTIGIEFSPAFNPTDTGLLLRATSPISRTSTSFRAATRFIQTSITTPFTVIDITADWETGIGIPYPPSVNTSCFNIGLVVQTVRLSSGIASPGLFKTQSLDIPLGGIGTMVIGSTFIVT